MAEESRINLDDCCTDSSLMIQSANDRIEKRDFVDGVTNQETRKHVRADRFDWDPMAPVPSFGKKYGWVSPFIIEAMKYLNLEKQQLPSRNPSVVSTVVEKAASGIIEAGKYVGKDEEAKMISGKLMEQKDQSIEMVWKCCARLYTMDSFLYRILNQTMRYIGSAEHENHWQSMIPVLGPFALLLWDDPLNKRPNRRKTLVYRGVNLSDTQITNYQQLSEESKNYRSFQAFTSCSRNMCVAEMFSSNAIFIMEINYAFTVDVQPFSQMFDEEEELIIPGVCFTVTSMNFDQSLKKFMIYLSLKHRQNGE